MKVIAISTSLRRHGNSETLLDTAISGVKVSKYQSVKVKKIILADLDIKPCTGCGACFKTGRCVIKDDMQGLYKDLLAADILLVASPVYFKGLPCQLKCVIDRCQALWIRKYVLGRGRLNAPYTCRKAKRVGAAVLVCASAGVKDMFLGAIVTLKAWFATMDIKYKKEFLAEGLEGKGDASKDKGLLKRAKGFGEKLI